MAPSTSAGLMCVKDLASYLDEKDIAHTRGRPFHPMTQGKIERYHRSDQEELYQLITYTDEVDLNEKVKEWEHFYNYKRPHGAFNGKTPYKALRTMLE